jgi:hypothetical protein
MWEQVLGENRSGRNSVVAGPPNEPLFSRLSEETVREIRGTEKAFERLERVLRAYGACGRNGNGGLHLSFRRLREILAFEERCGPRWIRPVIRYLKLEWENMSVSGRVGSTSQGRLLGNLARGTGLMKRFCGHLASRRVGYESGLFMRDFVKSGKNT